MSDQKTSGEPVADALSTGFYVTESGGGKYAINIGFRSMADMQAADQQLRDLLRSRHAPAAPTPINYGALDPVERLAVCRGEVAPVAVVMSFDFEHPSSKERRTVALSKQDVFDGMEDYFYDKIGEQICRCESVGETNVVDCSCDEYVHDFEIVKASLTS